MARLIDADDLIKTIPNTNIDMFENCGRCTLLDKEEVIAIINKAPTIEAEPVRQGKWIFTNKPNIYRGTTIKCSACGYEGIIAHIEDHHYCWVCGARMDEGEEE